jgi:hypothetical protein
MAEEPEGERYVSGWINDGSGYERIPLIGREATIERFRPWYERWLRRLDGHWQPFVKWDTEPVFTGTIEAMELSKDLSYQIRLKG